MMPINQFVAYYEKIKNNSTIMFEDILIEGILFLQDIRQFSLSIMLMWTSSV